MTYKNIKPKLVHKLKWISGKFLSLHCTLATVCIIKSKDVFQPPLIE